MGQGIAKASARTIATEAGVNQALVFYHFGSVDELLAAACEHGARQRIAAHRDALGAVTGVAGLVSLARSIHAQEQAAGNVALLGQLLAGSSSHPALGPATAAGLHLWASEVEQVLSRLLDAGPLAGLVDVPGLARAISASFVGILDQLGPVERAALRRRVRRATA